MTVSKMLCGIPGKMSDHGKIKNVWTLKATDNLTKISFL